MLTNQIGLSSSTKVFKHCPDSASHIRLCNSCEYTTANLYLPTYIRPSIAQDTMRVPSWLKLTDVTGSEWAGSTFKGLPCLSRQLFKPPTEPNQKSHYLLQRPKHGQFHQILQRQEDLNLDYSSNKKQNWCDQEGFSPHCATDWLSRRANQKKRH